VIRPPGPPRPPRGPTARLRRPDRPRRAGAGRGADVDVVDADAGAEARVDVRVGVVPGGGGGGRVGVLPGVEEDLAGYDRRGADPAEPADLVGVRPGVEVPGDDGREVGARAVGGHELSQRGDLPAAYGRQVQLRGEVDGEEGDGVGGGGEAGVEREASVVEIRWRRQAQRLALQHRPPAQHRVADLDAGLPDPPLPALGGRGGGPGPVQAEFAGEPPGEVLATRRPHLLQADHVRPQLTQHGEDRLLPIGPGSEPPPQVPGHDPHGTHRLSSGMREGH
jgi:hypothetical protein